jgi:hypothetical protein
MATQQYINNRKRYSRPQAVLFADQPPVFVNGVAAPPGFELSSEYGNNDATENGFIILSDHNRAPISMSSTRYENRQRMINAQMRSFYINEKMTISLSWERLPSRAYATNPDFSQSTGLSDLTKTTNEYTVDGGAGGAELLAWYRTHRGPFWVYLSYDNFATAGYEDTNYNNLTKYTEFYLMYITSFTHTIEKRGANNYDMWNVSINLEEV